MPRERGPRPGAEVPNLKGETIAILLRGWRATPPKGIDAGAHGFGGGMFDLAQRDGPARLWREHHVFLRRVAAEWAWEPTDKLPDGRRVFYGEACALSLDGRGTRETDKGDGR